MWCSYPSNLTKRRHLLHLCRNICHSNGNDAFAQNLLLHGNSTHNTCSWYSVLLRDSGISRDTFTPIIRTKNCQLFFLFTSLQLASRARLYNPEVNSAANFQKWFGIQCTSWNKPSGWRLTASGLAPRLIMLTYEAGGLIWLSYVAMYITLSPNAYHSLVSVT